MQEPAKAKKRIVSKGRFLFRSWQKSSLLALGLLLLVIGTLSAFGAVLAVLSVLWNHIWGAVIPTVAWGGIGGLFCWGGAIFLRESNSIEPGIPWTRSNTAALPVEESLVRASDEPELQQPEVLLRPVAHIDQTSGEELVRSSVQPPGASER